MMPEGRTEESINVNLDTFARGPMPCFVICLPEERCELWNDALVDAMCPIIQSHWTRANPEICLLGTHGAPLRLSGGIRKTIFAPQREHSRKPDEALERLEQLCAGPYVELNSRTNRPGWDAWGDQTGFFDEEEIGK